MNIVDINNNDALSSIATKVNNNFNEVQSLEEAIGGLSAQNITSEITVTSPHELYQGAYAIYDPITRCVHFSIGITLGSDVSASNLQLASIGTHKPASQANVSLGVWCSVGSVQLRAYINSSGNITFRPNASITSGARVYCAGTYYTGGLS